MYIEYTLTLAHPNSAITAIERTQIEQLNQQYEDSFKKLLDMYDKDLKMIQLHTIRRNCI